jgi:hypothetical protein
MKAHHDINPCTVAAWRNRVEASGVVVRRAFMGFVSPVLVASITRQAGDKPGPGGRSPRRFAP